MACLSGDRLESISRSFKAHEKGRVTGAAEDSGVTRSTRCRHDAGAVAGGDSGVSGKDEEGKPRARAASSPEAAETAGVNASISQCNASESRDTEASSRGFQGMLRDIEVISRSTGPASRDTRTISREHEANPRGIEPSSRDIASVSRELASVLRDDETMSRELIGFSRNTASMPRDITVLSRGGEAVQRSHGEVQRAGEAVLWGYAASCSFSTARAGSIEENPEGLLADSPTTGLSPWAGEESVQVLAAGHPLDML